MDLRMTSKEPPINEECREPQKQDGNTTASITNIDLKNKSLRVVKPGNTLG